METFLAICGIAFIGTVAGLVLAWLLEWFGL